MKPFLIYDLHSNSDFYELYEKFTIKKKRRSSFEIVEKNEINDDVFKLTYEWADSTRIEEKYQKKVIKNIESWVFKNYKKMVIFSFSESDVKYFISKFELLTGAEIKPINIYKYYIRQSIEEVNLENLLAFTYKKVSLSYSDENIMRVSRKNLNYLNLKDLMGNDNYEILTLTIKVNKGLVFEVDCNSSISLKETYSVDEKIGIISHLVEVL